MGHHGPHQVSAAELSHSKGYASEEVVVAPMPGLDGLSLALLLWSPRMFVIFRFVEAISGAREACIPTVVGICIWWV